MKLGRMSGVLWRRRYRMLQRLALGNSLNSTVLAVSQEFGCSEGVVYRDYRCMDRWGGVFVLGKQFEFVLHARLELLNRTATETMLGAKSLSDRVRAANLVLRVAQVQKQLGGGGRVQKGCLEGVLGKMPFECDPLIRRAYLDEVKRQRLRGGDVGSGSGC